MCNAAAGTGKTCLLARETPLFCGDCPRPCAARPRFAGGGSVFLRKKCIFFVECIELSTLMLYTVFEKICDVQNCPRFGRFCERAGSLLESVHIRETSAGVLLDRSEYLDLGKTFACGQAFRIDETADGFAGVVRGRVLRIRADEGRYIFRGIGAAEFDRVVRPYLDLDRDYAAIEATFAEDPVLRTAARYGRGIRILRQEPFETLITFIFSQNNNIPRIRGMVRRLCENFGDRLEDGFYAFPRPQRLAALTADDLAPVRAGFRARYVIDAARRVCDGSLPLELLPSLPYPQARRLLMNVCGVGAKIADCVLLFGAGRMEAFPVDVWIKRACEQFYPGGQPPNFGPYAGIAQQYLFYYVRSLSA